MKKLFGSVLVLLSFSAFAQAPTIDPPLTGEEAALVSEMQHRWQESGMPRMTDEQVAAFVTKMRGTRLEMMGMEAGMKAAVSNRGRQSRGGYAPAQTQFPMAQALPGVSSAALRAAIAERNANPRFTRFAPHGDGFLYDGAPYIDAEGVITSFGANSLTGAVTYLVDLGGGQFLVKHQNVHSTREPVLVGQAIWSGNRVTFKSVTGDSAGGEGLVPTSNGILVMRDRSLVAYDFANGISPRALPEGFSVAPLQAGDIAGTGYVLLERLDTSDSSNPLEALTEAAGALRSAFGKEVKNDYALFNLETQEAVTLNVPLRGKNVGEGTGCRPRNGFVNECSGWRTSESIWDTDGQPNYRHYFWAIKWFATKHGPLAVAMESGSKELNVIKLDTGERVNAFQRTLGISSFDASTTNDGSVSIKADWMFKTHEIADVSELFGS